MDNDITQRPTLTEALQTPAQQLAKAYQWVAEANHYMVGITCSFDNELWDVAEQVLIAEQNDLARKIKSKDLYESLYRRFDLALDLLQRDRKAGHSRLREG